MLSARAVAASRLTATSSRLGRSSTSPPDLTIDTCVRKMAVAPEGDIAPRRWSKFQMNRGYTHKRCPEI